MGDAERDIFWLGIALQSLVSLGKAAGMIKGKDSISEILGAVIAAYGRIDVSGNLSTEAESWSTFFRDNYGATERLRDGDKDRFISDCEKWIRDFSDVMRERYSHPKELYDRLGKIDIIAGAITQIQTAEHDFICTSPTSREIKDKVSSAIDGSQAPEEILLTGYFDNALLDKLTRALSRGVQVRLIVPRYSDRDRDNKNATRRIKNSHGLVKQHDTNHARIMVFGAKSALVSSADPKTDGLDQNFEAGIWTTNRTLIQKCKDFFDSLWNESSEWNL